MPFNRIIALSLLLVCLIAAIVGGVRSPESPTPSVTVSQERPNLFQPRNNRIVSLTLQGGISFEGGGFDPSGAIAIRNRLRSLIEDTTVRGVLLTINSPGGTVGTSQELYRAISSLREAKPIVVSIGDIAASGGYYAASAADVIVANPGSLTGSIGVIIQGLSFAELLDTIGVNPQTIKTGPYKDILSPTRDLTDTERDLLQALIDDSYEQFIEDVAAGRQHLPEKAEDVLGEAGISKREAMTVAARADSC
ncbi:MAG: signal peptide peptidase SppA [Synechococcaceae cyanobacterium SM2_3_60]|nr:signal peptide peptidase SppA [Synechococcaceae cyanobacterium SM2_3_60]